MIEIIVGCVRAMTTLSVSKRDGKMVSWQWVKQLIGMNFKVKNFRFYFIFLISLIILFKKIFIFIIKKII